MRASASVVFVLSLSILVLVPGPASAQRTLSHCSRRDANIVVHPGERKLLLVVPQDDIMEPMEFQWTYTAVNLH